ncbi:phage Gp19/Gp15/Gp42 family protein [Curtobacterium flaccumfaciens]|uniref:phage Gp19/Gp15/Gp42 family protein n=1 Tax=Curtobacterium flaccumfaciens TaxID=2035 RepID=UPI0022080811|nr:phage Gp19/Gp15/Gp42 family protein [Curtobacterium flaccumfaciens]UWD83654.1 phage Gp19/Gp15/Gp42 family protein [Curtobacterium flaccumfaciens]
MAWFEVEEKDIVSRFRPLDDDEKLVIETMIEDAQDIVEDAAEAASIPEPTTERGERTYKRIIASVVIRVLRNPDGYLTETTDGYTYRRDSALSSGALYVSDSELDQLRPSVRRHRGAFTIVPS